jgi:hypothetical protein
LKFPSDFARPAVHETFARTLPDLQCMKLLLLCGVVGTEVGIPLVRLSPI